MNPRDIFDYKCSSCKAMWEPQYFGWAARTGARLKTCNFCRAIRAARAEARREMRVLETVPETPEAVLWDAVADLNTYSESDEPPPNRDFGHYAVTATGSTETSEAEPIIVNLPPNSSELETEDEYLQINPFSSSAAAAASSGYVEGYSSGDFDEPEPEPRADFESDSD